MTIPTSSNYPDSLDTDTNLYEVHDALRLKLAEDYTPGDTFITVESNSTIMNKFPATGMITLTEQASDAEQRAISFYYGSRTNTTFNELELLAGFTDVSKPKRITNVTQNVMAAHHNNIKDAIIAIEEFLGTKGTIDLVPFGNTIVGRMNFIRKLILTPRAWFTADRTIGLVPFTVTFTDKSFRLGDGPVTYIWDFGDQDTSMVSVATISATQSVPLGNNNVLVRDLDGGTIEKTYTTPGTYPVKLTVRNEFGEDILEFENFISARTEAPKEAVIDFTPAASQITTDPEETPTFDRLGTMPVGPYTIPPTIRTAINTFINISIPDGNQDVSTTNAGERLDDDSNIIDPITSYTWSLGDDLTHPLTNSTKASYSIGGVYDLKLRVDTESGAYRITTYENIIDVIERTNLWLYLDASSVIKAYEFGLISETFKTATRTTTITTDDSFLDGTNGETRAKREFYKNAAFTIKGITSSGSQGSALLFYPSGGSPLSSQEVNSVEYEGFSDTYIAQASISRPWNWVFLSNGQKAYFILGPDISAVSGQNKSYQLKHSIDISSGFVTSTDNLVLSNYLNGAEELRDHITPSFSGGEPTNGRFAVYRSAWKGSSGYFLRNDRAGEFFRLASFYKTEGTIAEPFMNIKKLNNIGGTTKLEGELVPLSNGLFFFNNSGNISAYNDISNTWESGQTSTTFRNVQDSTINGFDNTANTLLAASDGNRSVYLSYDYSTSAFIKFNGTDSTFSSLGSRPTGTQWVMGIY